MPRFLSFSLVVGAATSLAVLPGCRDDHGPTGGPTTTTSLAPAASLSGSGAETASATTTIPDAKLAGAIDESFALDPVLSSSGVHASVANGSVTLSGTVPTLGAKWRAARLADTFKGATSLTSGIAVSPSARPDTEIANAVNDAIKGDPATRSGKVDASSSAATVTMRGTADSYLQRELMADAASRVPGVQEVNTLAVIISRAASRSDAEATADVMERFGDDALLDGTRIAVGVHGGEAVLSGIVGSLAQRDAAVHDSQIAGVTAVDSHGLHVDWRQNERESASARRPLPSDQHLVEAVGRSLSGDFRVGFPLPRIHVDQGVVTLSGNVTDFRAGKEANRDARGVSGVWRVEDRTVVAPARRENDATIQAQVQEGIHNDTAAPDSPRVRVVTANATVTLDGAVASEGEKKLLEEDVEDVPGVVAVENHLHVKGYGPETHVVPAGSIRRGVVERIFWDPRVETGRVTVDVSSGGEATLSGVLPSAAEVRAANDDAIRAGAEHVINRIRVAGPPLGSP